MRHAVTFAAVVLIHTPFWLMISNHMAAAANRQPRVTVAQRMHADRMREQAVMVAWAAWTVPPLVAVIAVTVAAAWDL